MNDQIKIIRGDSLQIIRALPRESVNCVITSPPYWGLRDYGRIAQIGLEATPGSYIKKIISIMDQIWHILRPDGTCWLNLGDSYAGALNKKAWEFPLKTKDLIGLPWRIAIALQERGWYLRSDIIWHKNNAKPESVKDRPTRAHEYIFLLAKNKNYYYDYQAVRVPSARKDQRPISNHQPRSNKGLPARQPNSGNLNCKARDLPSAQAYSGNLNFNAKDLPDPQPYSGNLIQNYPHPISSHQPRSNKGLPARQQNSGNYNREDMNRETYAEPSGFYSNPRSDRILPSRSNKGLSSNQLNSVTLNQKDQHFVTTRKSVSNEDLPDLQLNCDTLNQKVSTTLPTLPTLNLEEKNNFEINEARKTHGIKTGTFVTPSGFLCNRRTVWTVPYKNNPDHIAAFPEELIRPCVLAGCPKGGLVLDPFCGSGTVGKVCLEEGRGFIGIELNPDYAALAQERLGQTLS